MKILLNLDLVKFESKSSETNLLILKQFFHKKKILFMLKISSIQR